jgi:single-strand DNA-binding protein
MASYNRVLILGNLGKDPELKFGNTGTAFCKFSVATTDTWNDKDGNKQEKTEWHNITVFGKTAENCGQYLAKGRQVFVEGKLQTRSYDDKDGVKRYVTEIVAQQVKFLGGNPQGVQQTFPSASGSAVDDADDIPFDI